VAIKTLHASLDADRGALLQEAALLAQFECPYVVGLIGVVTVGSPVMVVLEFCEHGSLEHYLANTDIDLTPQYQFAGDRRGTTYLASIEILQLGMC
jgi:serine/threonine protein kinase